MALGRDYIEGFVARARYISWGFSDPLASEHTAEHGGNLSRDGRVRERGTLRTGYCKSGTR
ncbi:hypothetical protein GGTG_13463 [Gaeumannomyces tritici R3-111a-1]|uniref:Uncharacterized protein n=1 Tax=Gaeumannomyces tritici (strain R3-111a-1) TaxID=644352 RepID=J3PIY3_GAET3|nr:hypothetical protein GGTG_13463 [Gaeumannomyces tritici R3-111a-1]EJT68957.1 hypothetical protein GGTG_13463 [Gaeumannomyces tritici R3-111a-1]